MQTEPQATSTVVTKMERKMWHRNADVPDSNLANVRSDDQIDWCKISDAVNLMVLFCCFRRYTNLIFGIDLLRRLNCVYH